VPQLNTFFRARNWLAECKGDAAAVAELRWLHHRLGLGGNSHQLTADQIIDHVARALSTGRLHACRPAPMPAGKSTAIEGDRERLTEDEARRRAEASRTTKTWVEFLVVDMEGNPVSDHNYLVMLPDGSLHEGKLDKSGKVRFNGIDPGTAVFTLTDLDQDAWERVE
jgi:hypothetical protein